MVKRKKIEQEFQARLHGMEFKGGYVETSEDEFSEEQDAILEQAMFEAQRRKMQEMKGV